MDLKQFFQQEVKPSLGCTETGAVAYSSAAAAQFIDGAPERIHLRLSPNIYKNGKNVGIPGALGCHGLMMAAALGAIAGNPEAKLQALADIGQLHITQAEALVSSGKVTEEIWDDAPEVYAEVTLYHHKDRISAIVAQRHDFLAEIRKNGRTIKQSAPYTPAGIRRPNYLKELLLQDMKSCWELSQSISIDIENFLLSGVEMNLAAACLGLERPWGLGIGYAIHRLNQQKDLLWMIKSMAAAAADVRMAGGAMPIMSSAGSGNHGITAIIPAAVVAQDMHSTPRQLAEALALSHLVTAYIKMHIGLLTPICGCAAAAGMGAAAAIVKLQGGRPDQAEIALATLTSALMGMVCDGAKGSCAVKVSAAAGEAFMAALCALTGHGVNTPQGIISNSLASIAATLKTLSAVGMAGVDPTILKLLQDKLWSPR